MISVTIIVRNGERRLTSVLAALKQFPEIIIYDTGSTDRSLVIAAHFPNTKIYKRGFQGFGAAHNEAASLAAHDWILSLDSDEVATPELVDEIFSLDLDPKTVYSLPFKNFYNGKWITCCGWHPESHVRLYNRTKTRFSDAMVHEKIDEDGLDFHQLTFPVHHYSYDSVFDFLNKMQRYTTLFAAQYRHVKKATPWTAFWHGIGAFLKSYILKKGFLGKAEGFFISVYNGNTAFYKYMKLYQENQK